MDGVNHHDQEGLFDHLEYRQFKVGKDRENVKQKQQKQQHESEQRSMSPGEVLIVIEHDVLQVHAYKEDDNSDEKTKLIALEKVHLVVAPIGAKDRYIVLPPEPIPDGGK